jgi:GalNAc-alpha-(1->4)-GalNAc-alpha-(1->3)-diNAcBac-PP-undecaprenol alpha-1,4-N-acetyl-D-galactosaminyltransferase
MGCNKKTKITLVISSLTSGGAEKVMAQLANQASIIYEVNLVILSKKERFYSFDSRVKVIEPNFTIDQMPRVLFKWRNFWWLRKILKKTEAKPVLSFSGKYNAFVLLASLGLGKKVFISDRSRPGISYGKFLDFINPSVYRRAAGIIAQTTQAKSYAQKQSGHKNIQVIPNPIALPEMVNLKNRENLIANVGRFIASKHQDWLVNYFDEIDNKSWQLVFLGDGNTFKEMKDLAKNKSSFNRIHFKGNSNEVSTWYHRASIFAFTSTSEGFPNALAEAMAHGCACISYDCVAGPADIIDDGVNGFLIPEGEHELYKQKLEILMTDKELREKFGMAAREKMKQFDAKKITQRYLDFMLQTDA